MDLIPRQSKAFTSAPKTNEMWTIITCMSLFHLVNNTVYVFELNRNATAGTELAGESSDLTSSELVHAAENGDEKKS